MALDEQKQPWSVDQAPRVTWDNVGQPSDLRPHLASQHLPEQPRSRPV